MPRIVLADTVDAIAQAGVLFREYAAALTIDLAFQDFELEVASLPGEYAPPRAACFSPLFTAQPMRLAVSLYGESAVTLAR